MLIFACAAPAVDIPATWNGTTGNWNDPLKWNTNPAFPNNAGPTTYDATIAAGSVAVNQTITINQLTLSGGSLTGAFPLTLNEGIAWSGGATVALSGGGVTLGSGTASTVTGIANFNSGTIFGSNGAMLTVPSGTTFNMRSDANFFVPSAGVSYTIGNAGTFVSTGTSGTGFSTIDATFNNTGTLRVEMGGALQHTLSLAGGGMLGGSVVLNDSATILELGENTTLNNTVISGAGMPVVGGRTVVSGNVDAQRLFQAGGELHVFASATLQAPFGVTIDDGLVTGFGTIDATLDNQGNISPGLSAGPSAGTLTVTGDGLLGVDSRLTLEIGGTALTQFDRLLLGGAATLDGELELRLAGGFTPGAADTFTILTATDGASGVFENAPTSSFRLNTADGLGSFTVEYQANAVVLGNFLVPEPSSAALTVLSGGIVLILRRRIRGGPAQSDCRD